jgi:hypothetical protein
VTPLELAQAELRKLRWVDRLPQRDRREVENLVAAVAVRVAETLEEVDAAFYTAALSTRIDLAWPGDRLLGVDDALALEPRTC